MREHAAAIRTRAELARRLAGEIKEPRASAALREIADGLDADADMLERNVIQIKDAARRNEE
ncbi:hypothetical protein [Sphingomonas hankyongi]|uniref:Uncharacterized protein n=1 Tax=Sphingomonas hankyongi TaxID=2908209 RepID=A0ABT0S2K8_9SPHN|nr:hypothetical protein [Sphingomonas hankyongi]MCL6730105.1 hypothetical protein [Sphingomonas hankyongi]